MKGLMILVDPLFEEVSRYTSMKQIAEYYTGQRMNQFRKINCCFHNEIKEASMSIVYPKDKNFFKCFGCNRAGDVFNFVSEYYGLSRFDALKRIVRDFNIPVSVDNSNIKINEEKIKLLKREKEIISQLEDYVNQTEIFFCDIFRRCRFYCLDHQKDKFTLDYQFCLFVMNWNKRFQEYMNQLKHNEFDKKLYACRCANNRLLSEWKKHKKLLAEEVQKQFSYFEENLLTL